MSAFDVAKNMVDASYVDQGIQARRHRDKMIQALLTHVGFAYRFPAP